MSEWVPLYCVSLHRFTAQTMLSGIGLTLTSRTCKCAHRTPRSGGRFHENRGWEKPLVFMGLAIIKLKSIGTQNGWASVVRCISFLPAIPPRDKGGATEATTRWIALGINSCCTSIAVARHYSGSERCLRSHHERKGIACARCASGDRRCAGVCPRAPKQSSGKILRISARRCS